MADEAGIKVTADTKEAERALKELEKQAERFGATLTSSLKSAVISGGELEDVLRRIGLSLAGLALEQGLKPLQPLVSSLFLNIFKGLGLGGAYAKGGVPAGHIVPFAGGGVVSTPTYFQAGRSLGVMGEAGSEAILPLQRGADGRLGVAASGGAGAVNVVFNVTAQDAASFRKSEAQVTGMLARAVSRGARTL